MLTHFTKLMAAVAVVTMMGTAVAATVDFSIASNRDNTSIGGLVDWDTAFPGDQAPGAIGNASSAAGYSSAVYTDTAFAPNPFNSWVFLELELDSDLDTSVFDETRAIRADLAFTATLYEGVNRPVGAQQTIYFSHLFSNGAELEGWLTGNIVLNNLSGETPGQDMDPVWTSFQLNGFEEEDSGLFRAASAFSGNLFSLPDGQWLSVGDPSKDITFVGVGQLTMTVVPVPPAAGLILLGMAGFGLRRKFMKK